MNISFLHRISPRRHELQTRFMRTGISGENNPDSNVEKKDVGQETWSVRGTIQLPYPPCFDAPFFVPKKIKQKKGCVLHMVRHDCCFNGP